MPYRKNKAWGLSKGRWKTVCDRLRNGYSLKEAAWSCGVHTKTLEDWRKKNADFDRAVYLALMEWRMLVVEKFHDRGLNKRDRDAVRFIRRRLDEMQDGPLDDGEVDEFFNSVNKLNVNVTIDQESEE